MKAYRISAFLLIMSFISAMACAQQSITPERAGQVYKISIYERLRIDLNTLENRRVRDEITPLFVKSGNNWIKNDAYPNIDTFYQVKHVMKGNRVIGHLTTDNSFFYPEREQFYIPKPKLAIGHKNGFSVVSGTSDDTIHACFLTNNAKYNRNTTLRPYYPGKSDIHLIQSGFFSYIRNQYTNYCSSLLADSSFRRALLDSMDDKTFNLQEVQVDTPNTFTDGHNNRFITFIVPYGFSYHNYYPFNTDCFREDNGYKGLRITCYIDSASRLTFMGDELTYLDHGDFDHDGKDEYLFWYSIFNHEGYILYYNDFKSRAEFKWSYH